MFFVFLNLKLIGCFNSILSFDWILGESAINLFALFLINQIAGNTIDFKINVIIIEICSFSYPFIKQE